MSRLAWAGALCGFVATAACGGKVTWVEGSGTGAGGDAATSTGNASTSHGASTSTGTATCEDLLAAFTGAVEAAQVCDPKLDVVQCDGSVVLFDACDCPSLVLNEDHPALVKAAVDARAAWVGAGCPSLDCGACFEAMGGTCSPATGPGGMGVCVGLSLN
ncbi:MAG: hypothetical protein U0414_25550 [Polyangiaceae bacterium]